jgi:hypothetical protein
LVVRPSRITIFMDGRTPRVGLTTKHHPSVDGTRGG